MGGEGQIFFWGGSGGKIFWDQGRGDFCQNGVDFLFMPLWQTFLINVIKGCFHENNRILGI